MNFEHISDSSKSIMFDLILDWQIKILLGLGVVCVPIVFLNESRGSQVLVFFLISLAISLVGLWLYTIETSINWLNFSYSEWIKNVIGVILIFVAWRIFLGEVLALAIASLTLKFS